MMRTVMASSMRSAGRGGCWAGGAAQRRARSRASRSGRPGGRRARLPPRRRGRCRGTTRRRVARGPVRLAGAGTGPRRFGVVPKRSGRAAGRHACGRSRSSRWSRSAVASITSASLAAPDRWRVSAAASDRPARCVGSAVSARSPLTKRGGSRETAEPRLGPPR